MRISDWSSDVCSSDLAGLDVHDHARGTAQQEAIGTGDGGTVEQRVDRDRLVLAARRLEPIVGEVGKLLGAGGAGRERDAARGEADLAELADAAEIGGAEEGRPGRDLVEAALAERLVHPEAGEGRGLLAEPRRYVTRIDGEQRRVVVDLAGSATVDRSEERRVGKERVSKGRPRWEREQ